MGLFPKLVLLGWGEHALGQSLLCAQGCGTAPHPVLFGLLGIVSLHLQNAPGEMGTLLGLTLRWDGIGGGTLHRGKTSEL